MKTKIRKDALQVLSAIKEQDTPNIYAFGNGGSASLANHMAVDWVKNSDGLYDVRSLASSSSMLTMIANDYGYHKTCSKQLEWYGSYGAITILISSSGNSKNVIEGAKAAKELKHLVIGFTGFDGGKLKPLCDISVHINSNDYGTVEDYHSNVMHEVARLLKGKV